MNLNKIIATSLFLAGVVSSVNAADFEVRLTGSTAFRAQVFAALGTMGLTKTDAAFANNQGGFNFTGTLSGKSVNVFCAFSGSVEGIRDVTLNNNVLFTNGVSTGTSTAGLADYALSDCFQSSTSFLTPTLVGVSAVAGKPGIAIQPFTWGANANAIAAGITNITPKITDGLLANGYWPKSFWTGNSNHIATAVNVTGRYNLSGTRVITLAETGYGIFNQVQQKKVVANVWMDFAFDDGYGSGSSVRVDLSNASTGEPGVGYFGLSDAAALTGGAQPISWNGVNVWAGGAAGNFDLERVRNGSYTFWGYEHLYKKSTLSGFAVTLFEPAFVAAMKTQLDTSTTAANVSSMWVYRNKDGGPILPN